MENIDVLIQLGYECDYLDFKEKQYSKENHLALIIDIMAMANSRYEGNKYIIIGVKDRPEGKEIKGIDPEEFIDSSNYIQIVHNTVEPDIRFDYFKYSYGDKILGVLKIYDTVNRPYMFKRQYEKYHVGFCKIRKGSMNAFANRSDFDDIYLNKGKFEIRFLEQTLHAVHDADGCASIEVAFSNLTDLPVTIIAGELKIIDNHGNELTQHTIFGFNKYVGADFKLTLQPKSEEVGHLFVGFSSSHPLRLNIDEYGYCGDKYCIKLLLLDARHKEYSATIKQATVVVDGDFLWKVKQRLGIKHKFRSH